MGDSYISVYNGLTGSYAVVTQTGMYGGAGGWAVLNGNSAPDAYSELNLKIDEGGKCDNNRRHNPERVGYIIIQ